MESRCKDPGEDNFMRRGAVLVFLIFFLIFAALSYIYTPELRTDAFSHFLHSVDAVSHLKIQNIVTNVWDKPIPLIIYGVSGLAGLFFARLASVILVLLTAYFILNLARRFIRNMEGSPALTIVFFLLLIPVFGQTFLTMTELPAAFVLSFGLFLFYLKRAYLPAFLAIGFLPLARVECSLMMAFLFISFSYEVFLNKRFANNKKNLLEEFKPIFWYLVVGSSPFVLWNAGGAYFTKDVFWLLHSSYAYLRPYDLFYIIKHNAVTALPMVFTAPALSLFLIGVFSPKEKKEGAPNSLFFVSIYGILIIYLIFLSSVIPFAKGEVGWEKLIAAWNDRNFNVIAPVISLFVYMGVSYIYEMFYNKRDRSINRIGRPFTIGKTVSLFIFSALLILICPTEFPFSSSTTLYLMLLFLFAVVCFVPPLAQHITLKKMGSF